MNMTALGRWLMTLRRILGWGDLSETRLSPAHGWLLRDPSKTLPQPGRKT